MLPAARIVYQRHPGNRDSAKDIERDQAFSCTSFYSVWHLSSGPGSEKSAGMLGQSENAEEYLTDIDLEDNSPAK